MTIASRLRKKLPLDQQVAEQWDILEQHAVRLDTLEAHDRGDSQPITVRPQWRSLPPVLRSIPPFVRRHRGGVLSGGTAALVLLLLQEILRWLAAHPW